VKQSLELILLVGFEVVCFLLVTCLAYSSTLKMEEEHSFKTLVKLYWTVWHHISEDSFLHSIAEFLGVAHNLNTPNKTIFQKMDVSIRRENIGNHISS
jgi:hypothetical protein